MLIPSNCQPTVNPRTRTPHNGRMATTTLGGKHRVAIIGCGTGSSQPHMLFLNANSIIGFMGTALLSGILKALDDKQAEQLRFSISAPSSSSIERLKTTFGAQRDQVDTITTDNVEAVRDSETVILGIQPQQLDDIFSDEAFAKEIRGKLIVSLLAGVSTAKLVETIKGGKQTAPQSRVVRVIPSIGAQISESATLIAESALDKQDQDRVQWLFQLVGKSVLVPEQLMNTATAISATCHALTIVATDAVVDASVAEGIPRSVALDIASQCLRSAASTLQGQATIESFKDSMSVPRGITITSLLQLERGQVRSGISDAARHAVHYANSMSGE